MIHIHFWFWRYCEYHHIHHRWIFHKLRFLWWMKIVEDHLCMSPSLWVFRDTHLQGKLVYKDVFHSRFSYGLSARLNRRVPQRATKVPSRVRSTWHFSCLQKAYSNEKWWQIIQTNIWLTCPPGLQGSWHLQISQPSRFWKPYWHCFIFPSHLTGAHRPCFFPNMENASPR